MPVIITLPDELAEKLQAQADALMFTINDCAIDILEKALEVQSAQKEDDFKILGGPCSTPQPAVSASHHPANLSEEKASQDDDASGLLAHEKSDFDNCSAKWALLGHDIRRSSATRPSELGETEAEVGASAIASEMLPDEESYQNADFKKLGTVFRGSSARNWLLDASVSPINDHKYRLDLEEWSRLWASVKIEMKYVGS